MRRTPFFLGVIVVVAVTAGIAWRTRAQPTPAKPAETPASEPSPARVLPLTQVVLFSSGVAYFQREGTIEGDTRVDLTFPVADVNDILKSLVFHDLGGGKLRAVSYDSQEPIERTLKAFALDLTTNPTLGELINQARGEKVEVTLQNNAAQPAAMSGTIMGMEAQNHPGPKGTAGTETDVLNLVCAEGVRSVPLAQVSRLRFLNAALDAEFHKALDVLAAAHNSQKRTVSLHLTGAGKRTVKIGYVIENPIWKTSYRLLLNKKEKPTLQGFAVVENTTDEDWKDVRLTLVSGRPVSFQMDLYQPLFLPRPTVEPERFASLRPPVYQGDVVVGQLGGLGQVGALGAIGQIGALGQIGQIGAIGQLGALGQLGGTVNRYQGSVGSQGQQDTRVRLSYEELQRRRGEKAKLLETARQGEAIATADSNAIEAALQAEGVGDHYQYVVEEKLTLPRQKSAMLLVVTHDVEAERYSIYNPVVNLLFPLLGVRFKNTTGQHLAQGPMTVYEDDSYAGDARLPDLSPGERRPIGYAIDLGMQVKIVDDWTIGPRVTLEQLGDQVSMDFDKRHTRKYLIRNRLKEDRRVILDHPIRNGLRLNEENKPEETTHSRYRFLVETAGDKTTTFAVTEEERCSGSHNSKQRVGDNGETIRFTNTGLQIETEETQQRPVAELAGVTIYKGGITAKTRFQKDTIYRVNQATGRKLDVTLNYKTQPERTVEGGSKVFPNGTLYRFAFEVPGRIGTQTVTERWTVARPVAQPTEEELAQFLASPAVSVKVKEALARCHRAPVGADETNTRDDGIEAAPHGHHR